MRLVAEVNYSLLLTKPLYSTCKNQVLVSHTKSTTSFWWYYGGARPRISLSLEKKELYGGNRKGWRRVSVNSIHPLLPFPKKRKHSNEKILFKRAFPDRLALNQSLPKSKKKSKTKKSLTWTMKFEFRDKRDECCWVNLFSMLFS